MSSLTFDCGLLKDRRAEPLEGHAVVVFERVGESGDRLHSVLLPGGPPFRKPLLRRMSDYFAYAVDTTPGQCLRFNEFVRMADHLNELTLNFSVYYDVADPRQVAARWSADPLQKVRERVGTVVGDEVAHLDWEVVKKRFREAGEEIVLRHMPALRTFAREFGMELLEVRLRERVSRDLLPVEKEEREARDALARMAITEELKVEEAATQHRLELEKIRHRRERLGAEGSISAQQEAARHAEELEKIRRQRERELEEERVAAEQEAIRVRLRRDELERRRDLVELEEATAAEEEAQRHRIEMQKLRQEREALELSRSVETLKLQAAVQRSQAEAVVTVLDNVSGNTRTALEALEAARAGQEIAQLLRGGAPDGWAPDGGGALPAGASAGMLPAPAGLETLADEDPLIPLLGELVVRTRTAASDGQLNRLRSALLHVAAEVVGKGRKEAEFADLARQAIRALDPQPGGDTLAALERLANPQHLRDTLAA